MADPPSPTKEEPSQSDDQPAVQVESHLSEQQTSPPSSTVSNATRSSCQPLDEQQQPREESSFQAPSTLQIPPRERLVGTESAQPRAIPHGANEDEANPDDLPLPSPSVAINLEHAETPPPREDDAYSDDMNRLLDANAWDTNKLHPDRNNSWARVSCEYDRKMTKRRKDRELRSRSRSPVRGRSRTPSDDSDFDDEESLWVQDDQYAAFCDTFQVPEEHARQWFRDAHYSLFLQYHERSNPVECIFSDFSRERKIRGIQAVCKFLKEQLGRYKLDITLPNSNQLRMRMFNKEEPSREFSAAIREWNDKRDSKLSRDLNEEHVYKCRVEWFRREVAKLTVRKSRLLVWFEDMYYIKYLYANRHITPFHGLFPDARDSLRYQLMNVVIAKISGLMRENGITEITPTEEQMQERVRNNDKVNRETLQLIDKWKNKIRRSTESEEMKIRSEAGRTTQQTTPPASTSRETSPRESSPKRKKTDVPNQ